MILLLMLVIPSFTDSITLPDDLAKEVTDLIKQFLDDPTDARFKQEVHFGPHGLYSIFIYSPIEQYSIEPIICPLHGTPLTTSSLTANFDTRNRNLNPRLVFGLERNIILIQRIYKCQKDHKIYSCSDDLLLSLPSCLPRIPYKIYHRTAFTLNLVDFVFVQISKGNNFHTISETIADLHLMEYERRRGTGSFYQNELTKYPSHDKVRHPLYSSTINFTCAFSIFNFFL